MAQTQKILSKKEIEARIEQLTPGAVAVFFVGRSPRKGGPLGAGASVVELNPDFPKKGKKYIISSADVVNDQVVNKTAWFSGNKASDIAGNIVERQEPWAPPA